MKKSKLIKLMNFYPPFIGAGVRLKRVTDDFKEIDVEMKLRFWNKNYVGTHFGGSLYSMVDPFLMLMLIENLGKDYVVWDKSAAIDFKRPGRETVVASFKLSDDVIEDIKEKANKNYKVEPVFDVFIKNLNGEIIAKVNKKLYVRKKIKK